MNESDPMEAPLATVSDTEFESMGTRPSIRTELRRLGQLLQDALRAAAGTQEAQELRAELRDGMEALRREMDSAVESTRNATGRVRTEAAPSSDRVRTELAEALRAVNRALDRMAQSVEPGATSADDDEEG